MTPKVSVATCSYNRPSFLCAAVESMRAQTDGDFEHLIYDDGSTDPAVDEVLAWAAKDPRVRVWRGEKNQDRPAAVWNLLLDRARGRYFATLDDDDEKLPSFVAAMSAALEAHPEAGFVTCGFLVRTEGQPDWEHHHNLRTSPEEVERASTCASGAVLYRREVFDLVGRFSEDIRTNEDWDWVRRALRKTSVVNLPECHMVYRQHASNRQRRAEALGHNADVARLRSR